MKITFRLLVSLILMAALVASVFSYLQVQSEQDRLTGELERRAIILAESLQETVRQLLHSGSAGKLKRLAEQFGNREKLVGVAIYDSAGAILASTQGLAAKIQQPLPQIAASIEEDQGISGFENVGGTQTHIYAAPLHQEDKFVGTLVLFHDASFIDARLKGIWYNNFIRFLTLSLLIIITTVLVMRWSITGPIAQIADWLKGLRMEKINRPVRLPRGDILGPLANELTHLAKSLASARASAQEEARLRIAAESLWTVERLKEHVRLELDGKTLFVVSNREPYMHTRQGRQVACIVPAGGLVTALDPILRACEGVWIAHGSGEADRETADKQSKLRVPPEEPVYTLKRVWLTKEEEEGYYYGFSNEGLWPLCHITHTRPIFRHEDWIQYQQVNEKFAQALLEEIASEESPLVLVQDYHFALLPLLVKSRRPDARVGIFWHIPWPNPEVFGICPWKKELLLGLLKADLIGFQTQFHCNNFLETIDRFLESKIDWDQFSVEHRGHTTLVKPFPISVAYPSLVRDEDAEIPAGSLKQENLLKEIGVRPKYLGVGVDRIDYTKGIIERFRAVERFLQKYPDFVGQFTFVELGAPSRTHIKRYHELIAEVEETADKINWRFQTKDWKPIVFLKAHHTHEKVNRFFKAADICMVTSLHDGMNLVAKEFIAARDNEDGVLILSQFAGASTELPDALIVNPYDIEEMAEVIHSALIMEQPQRSERMRRLRAVVKERNVYRWAANLVTSLGRLRTKKTAEEEN